jgi:hypothetical protein
MSDLDALLARLDPGTCERPYCDERCEHRLAADAIRKLRRMVPAAPPARKYVCATNSHAPDCPGAPACDREGAAPPAYASTSAEGLLDRMAKETEAADDLDAARAELLEHRAFFMAAEHKDGPKSIAEVLSGRLVAVEKERDAARASAESIRATLEPRAERAEAEVERLTAEITRWLAETEEAHSNAVEQRDRAERAEAEVERLKDPDGDHHYMKRLLAQERERARLAELCECGEPECIKQQVTEQRLRAERAEALGRELAEAGRGADWVLALMKDQIDHEDPDVVAAEAALSVALARAKDAGWL